ncbi:MAG: hypothetical protein KC731_42385 [Myxococcales bacterium]|nr:hypothetical protein [Myxococcales bacterium]
MGFWGKSRQQQEAEQLIVMTLKATLAQTKIVLNEIGNTIAAVNSYVELAATATGTPQARAAFEKFKASEGPQGYLLALKAVEERVDLDAYAPVGPTFAKLVQQQGAMTKAMKEFQQSPSSETDEELSRVLRKMMQTCARVQQLVQASTPTIERELTEAAARSRAEAADVLRDSTHTAAEMATWAARKTWRHAVSYVGRWAPQDAGGLVERLRGETKMGDQIKTVAEIEQVVTGSGYIPVRQRMRKLRRLRRRLRQAYDGWRHEERVDAGPEVLKLCTELVQECGELDDIVGGDADSD